MSFTQLRYELQLMGKRVILTPILVMLAYALIATYMHYRNIDPARFLASSLEIILPLAAAIIATTITSQDAAIELQLTVPKKYHVTVSGRLILIALWTLCIALISGITFSALHLGFIPQQPQPFAAPVAFLAAQLAWFAPLLWLVGIGLCLAMLIRNRAASTAALCGVWLLEIIFKDYIALTNWLHPVFLFPTTLLALTGTIPQNQYDIWLSSRLEVLGTGLAFICIGWLLLHSPERLLKASSEE
ncbi:MAG TPA: hypothetical protein VKU38_20265 [Ktedonobacteraceae bacterium]|nr:hypothetical protein [Ktedonobacteraceae bacterium]